MRNIENENQKIKLESWEGFRRLTIQSKSNKDYKLNSKNEWVEITIKQDNYGSDSKIFTFNKIIDLSTTIMGKIVIDENNQIYMGFIHFCHHKRSSKHLKQINGIYRLEFANNIYTITFIQRNGSRSFPLAKGIIDEQLTPEVIDNICNKIIHGIDYYAKKRFKNGVNINDFSMENILKQEAYALKELSEFAIANNDESLLKLLETYTTKHISR